MDIKVAKIISTKQLIINAGKDQKIKLGQRFEIIDYTSFEVITDPETNKKLGRIYAVKGNVIVSKVYSKMALVEAPYENSLFSIQTDLNVDPKEITGGLPAPSLNPIIQHE